MKWPWQRRELGAMEPVFVRVWAPGSKVGDRFIRPGRVAVTWEDHTGRVLVEADYASLGAMLEEAARRVRSLERTEIEAQIRASARRHLTAP